MTNESTEPDQSRLSERQHIAIDVLLMGGTHEQGAEAAGVCRTTVTGWVNHHVPFIAELNRRRQERSQRLSQLTGEALCKAMEVIIGRLEDEDLGAAVALLRLVDSSTLYQAPPLRPITIQSTTTRLADEMDREAMLESFTPSHAVFAVEDRSNAHSDEPARAS